MARPDYLQNVQLGGVYVYPNNSTEKVTPNFVANEFDDDHSLNDSNHFTLIDYELVLTLEAIRFRFDLPIYVTSGFRTTKSNELVGGATESFHTLGMAYDFSIHEIDMKEVFEYIKERATKKENLFSIIGGIGFYPKRNFIHIDSRPRPESGEVIIWEG